MIERVNVERIGGVILRWSLVLFFLGFGLLKFTAGEANAIAPLVGHSRFMSWLGSMFGTQGSSNVIGVIEVMTGLAIASRHFLPGVSAVGSLMAAVALVMTISFLFTTPGLDADPWESGFLAKDLTLLGAALWSAGEAYAAWQRRRQPSPQFAA